jgi:hypothetical protein
VTRPTRAGYGALLLALLLSSSAIAETPAPASPDCHVVVDYQESTPGSLPAGWQARNDDARNTYRVVTEGGLAFVRATAEGTGSQMGREFPWDVSTHPVLSWRWRPRAFPPASDERSSGKSDSALSVYAVFGQSAMATRAVKYIWSRVVPVGTTLGSSRARAIVLRTGAPSGDEWATETVDVRRDYERLYGEAPEKARGVAILTDADQTQSRAVGDYGPFRVCPEGAR